MRSPIDRDMALHSGAFQMRLNCEAAGFEGFWFAPNVVRRRRFAAPPMIEDAWNVVDARVSFDNSIEQVVILRRVEFRTEAADLAQKADANDCEMADVICGVEKIR